MSSSGIVPLTVLTKPSVDFASGTSDPEVVPSCPTLTFSPNGALRGSISTIPSPDTNIFLWGGIVIGSRSTLSGCDPDPSLKVPSADTVKSPRLDSANLPLTGFTTNYPLPSIARSSGTPVG